MARLRGPLHTDILTRGDEFSKVVTERLHTTLDQVASSLHGFVTPDDLNQVQQRWASAIDEAGLLDHVTDAHQAGAALTRDNQRAELARLLSNRLTAAPTATEADAFQVPLVQNHAATEMLANARNRLVATGDEIWLAARNQLSEGLRNGEGIADLRQRVSDSVNFSETRAQLVARSEISHAMNQGSIAQMQQLDLPSATKEWIAIMDDRTRPEHAAADGEKVPLDGGVFSTGDDPGDDYNCRCTVGFDAPDDDYIEATCPGCADTAAAAAEPPPTTVIKRLSELPDPGASARYDIIPGKRITKAALNRANLTNRDLQARVLHLNDVIMNRFGGYFSEVEDTIQLEGGDNMAAYVRNGNILGVNPAKLVDSVIKEQQDQGWLMSGTGKAEDVLVHEYGHFLLGRRALGVFGSARRDAAMVKAELAAREAGMPTGYLGQSISRYAATSENEAKAELWAKYHMGGASRPPWVIKWGETLLHELGLDTTPLCADIGACP